MTMPADVTDLIPPEGCDLANNWTSLASFLVGGCAYASVMALALTMLAYRIYDKWQLHDDALIQIRRFGTLGVLSTFFLSLGIFIVGFVVRCTLGCSSYATDCASISCVVANHVPEGYVILAVLLLVGCGVVLRAVNDLTIARMELAGIHGLHTSGASMIHGRSWALAPAGEWMLRSGFVLTVVTGLVPSPASNCGVQPQKVTEVAGDDCFNERMSVFHASSIVFGLIIAIVGTLLRLFGKRYVKGEWKSFRFGCNSPYITAMVVISLVFLLLPGVALLGIYKMNDSGSAAEVDFCSRYTTREACSGQELPSLWYTWASARKMDDNPGLTQDGWQCEWLEAVSMTSAPCVRANCDANGRLGPRKLAIVAEYLGLVIGVFGIYFAIWAIAILDKVTANINFAQVPPIDIGTEQQDDGKPAVSV